MKALYKIRGFALSKLALILPVLLIIPLMAEPADAVGLGIYLQGGLGSSDLEGGTEYTSVIGNTSVQDQTSDAYYTGAGLVLDTNLSRDRLFSYRLYLGIEKFHWDSFPGGRKLDLEQFVMTHDFGFTLESTDEASSWVGPELRLTYLDDHNRGVDVDGIGVAIGLAYGINYHRAYERTLALKVSIMTQALNGASYDDHIEPYPGATYTSSSFSARDNFVMVTIAYFLRIAE